MSHISRIELEIKDLQSLKEACKRLGFEFCDNQQSYQWYGHWVGDSPLPEGITEDQLGKCDHAIKVPGAQYEVGVVRKGQSYILLYDEWIKGGLKAKLGVNAGLLKQAYTIETLRKEARQKNYRFHETKMKNQIRVTLTL
jgi:hypothetical protein